MRPCGTNIISGVILRKLWLFRNPGTAEQLHCSKSTSEIDRKGQETILLSGNSRFNFFLQANPKSFLSIIRDCQLYLVWNQWFGSPRCDLGTYCTVFISVDRRWESLGPALLKRMEHLDNVILICFHNVPYKNMVYRGSPWISQQRWWLWMTPGPPRICRGVVLLPGHFGHLPEIDPGIFSEKTCIKHVSSL